MTETILDHDERGERAYPGGRQPFGYRAIVRWAEVHGWRWKVRRECRRVWPCGVHGGCNVVEHQLWVEYPPLGWVPFRGVTTAS